MAPSGSAPLLVASNRGPLSFTEHDDGDAARPAAAAAGWCPGCPACGSDDVVWVCAALSDGDRAAARAVPDGRLDRDGHDTGGMAVRMLDIDPATFHRAYNADRQLDAVVRAPPALRHPDGAGVRRDVPARVGVLRGLQPAPSPRRWPRRRARAPRSSCRTTTSRCSRGCCATGGRTCGSRTSRTRRGRRPTTSGCCPTPSPATRCSGCWAPTTPASTPRAGRRRSPRAAWSPRRGGRRRTP